MSYQAIGLSVHKNGIKTEDHITIVRIEKDVAPQALKMLVDKFKRLFGRTNIFKLKSTKSWGKNSVFVESSNTNGDSLKDIVDRMFYLIHPYFCDNICYDRYPTGQPPLHINTRGAAIPETDVTYSICII